MIDKSFVDTMKSGSLTEKSRALVEMIAAQQTAELSENQSKKFKTKCEEIITHTKTKDHMTLIELATVAFNDARKNML